MCVRYFYQLSISIYGKTKSYEDNINILLLYSMFGLCYPEQNIYLLNKYLDPKPTHTIILEFQCQKHTTSVLHVGLHGGYTHVTHLSKWVDRFDNSKWLMVMLVQRIMSLTTYSIVWLLQRSWASQTWLVCKVSSTCNFPLRVATSGNYMVWTW